MRFIRYSSLTARGAILSLSLLLCSSVGLATAKPGVPPVGDAGQGWVEVRPEDLARPRDSSLGPPLTASRKIRAEGDFDGDGVTDIAVLRKNVALGHVGVFACIMRAARACDWKIVADSPLRDLPNIGMRATRPKAESGCAASAAGAGVHCVDTANLCAMMAGVQAADCIDIFTVESGGALYRWDGRKFAGEFYSD